MERVIGMGFIAISAVGFGMMPLFANIAYQAGATPASVLFLRFSIAALIMLGITIKTQEAFPGGKSLLVLVLMGAVGYHIWGSCYRDKTEDWHNVFNDQLWYSPTHQYISCTQKLPMFDYNHIRPNLVFINHSGVRLT